LNKLIIVIILGILGGFFGFLEMTNDIPSVNPVNTRVHSGKINKTYLEDKECLVQALWYEARGEGQEGIRNVAKVIQNRVNSKGFPGDYCGVIHQRGQFTYKDHSRKPLKTPRSSQEQEVLTLVYLIAEQGLTGRLRASVGSDVLWYHALKSKPSWGKKFKRVKVHGNHVFYSKE
jgi:N-acetylmuramoyl-L-alanine amidase